tara:strand:- start:493 stop:972 length:480 start_codon:yes stop_codon:yes gene_type:complete
MLESTKKVVDHIVTENPSAAKSEIENILYAKMEDALELKKIDIASSMAEAKKPKKDEDDEDEKDDDGDGLDPVGDEDDDVDNDGDSDDSDEYLKNRRKAVSKAIKKDKAGVEENEKTDAAARKAARHARSIARLSKERQMTLARAAERKAKMKQRELRN